MKTIGKTRAVRIKPAYFNDKSKIYRIEVEIVEGEKRQWIGRFCVEQVRIWNHAMKRMDVLYVNDSLSNRYPTLTKAKEHARELAEKDWTDISNPAK